MAIWIPNTRHASGTADSPANVERYLQQIIGNRADASLRARFLEAGPEAVEVLENHSEVRLRAYARHPDYRSELEGAAVAGRALEPLPFIVVVVDEIPRLPSGKVLRRTLRHEWSDRLASAPHNSSSGTLRSVSACIGTPKNG